MSVLDYQTLIINLVEYFQCACSLFKYGILIRKLSFDNVENSLAADYS